MAHFPEVWFSVYEIYVILFCIGKSTHGRRVGVKRVIPRCSKNITCRKCEQNIGEAVEQEGMLSDEVETLKEFTILGDKVSEGVCCCMAGDFI